VSPINQTRDIVVVIEEDIVRADVGMMKRERPAVELRLDDRRYGLDSEPRANALIFSVSFKGLLQIATSDIVVVFESTRMDRMFVSQGIHGVQMHRY